MMRLVKILSCIFLQFLTIGSAQSQTYPDRPLRLIIPYTAGGTTDILLRLLQNPVSEAVNQQMVIENRPGGGSVIGTNAVAQAAPDGYTVLGTDLAILVNHSLMPKLPYDTLKDFRGVSMLARAPLLLLIHPSVAANTVEEFVSLLKQNPGKYNFGSGGYGTSTHIAGEMFLRAAGVKAEHIPFQGVTPAMNALLGGQVQFYFGGTTTALQHLQTGRLKALAITGDSTNPLVPDVPTFLSRGIKGVEADSYWGIYVPAKTSDSIVATLNKAFVTALRDPAVIKRAGELGLSLIGNSPSQHDAQISSMINSWGTVIKSAGIQVN
jgi:tripartite-type tricarboxylate transporter receptor subunit TctC